MKANTLTEMRVVTGTARILPATQEGLDLLKGRFRQGDVEEVFAMSGRGIDEAAQEGLRTSELCWIGYWDEDPIAIFGCRRHSLLSDEGTPWLLGTERIREQGIKQAFLAANAPYIKAMLQHFDFLENFVDARNTVSIKWLKRLGFTIEPAMPMGYLKMPFHRFWLRR